VFFARVVVQFTFSAGAFASITGRRKAENRRKIVAVIHILMHEKICYLEESGLYTSSLMVLWFSKQDGIISNSEKMSRKG
jgi:hypothetical protein